MFFGISSIMIAALVDAYYVGQLGTQELAAVSLTFPLFMAMTSVAMGLGIGATSVISRKLGSGDRETSLTIGSHTILLVVGVVIVVEILGFSTMRWLYVLLGTDESLMTWVVTYTQILFVGLPFFAIAMVGGMMLRSMGDITTAAVIMIAGSGLQVLIAPLLIFGIGSWGGLGIYGSAWAFVVSRVALFIYAVFVFKQYGLFRSPGRWVDIRASWLAILRLGFPAIASQMIHPISMGILLSLLSTFGTAVVAAYGIVNRIEGLALMVMMALSSSLGPIVGQNFGARQFHRVKHAISLSYRFSLIYGTCVAILLCSLAYPIAGFFRDDPTVIEAAALYLYIVPITFTIGGIGMVSGSTFVAYGEALPSFTLSMLRSILLLVPVAYVLQLYFGYLGIFAAIAVTNLMVGSTSFFWLRSSTNRHIRNAEKKQDEVTSLRNQPAHVEV